MKRRKHYRTRCANPPCGRQFRAATSTAKFCSNACRQADYLRRREEREAAEEAAEKAEFWDRLFAKVKEQKDVQEAERQGAERERRQAEWERQQAWLAEKEEKAERAQAAADRAERRRRRLLRAGGLSTGEPEGRKVLIPIDLPYRVTPLNKR